MRVVIEPEKKAYDGQLPPTKCYNSLYLRLKAVSDENNVSMGEIIRQALEKFLNDNAQKQSNGDRK